MEVKYDLLNAFSVIFERSDFTFISLRPNVDRVVKILNYDLYSEGDVSELIDFLRIYLHSLESFHSWINAPREAVDLISSLTQARSVVEQAIRLLSLDASMRVKIPRNQGKRMADDFIYSLSKLVAGLKLAFDPDIIIATAITRDQFARYFLNRVVGLARNFAFNSIGRHSSANKIAELDKRQLSVTERLLLREHGQERTFGGWRDYGERGTAVRILAKGVVSGRSRVYFIYRVNEHPAYQDQLNNPNADFREAA